MEDRDFEPPEYTNEDAAFDAFYESLCESNPAELLEQYLTNINHIACLQEDLKRKICKIQKTNGVILKVLNEKLKAQAEHEKD